MFALWTKENRDRDQDTANLFIKLNDNEIFRTDFGIDFQGTERCRSIVVVGGLVLAEVGLLRFEVSKDGRHFGTWEVPLRTVAIANPPAPVPA